MCKISIIGDDGVASRGRRGTDALMEHPNTFIYALVVGNATFCIECAKSGSLYCKEHDTFACDCDAMRVMYAFSSKLRDALDESYLLSVRTWSDDKEIVYSNIRRRGSGIACTKCERKFHQVFSPEKFNNDSSRAKRAAETRRLRKWPNKEAYDKFSLYKTKSGKYHLRPLNWQVRALWSGSRSAFDYYLGKNAKGKKVVKAICGTVLPWRSSTIKGTTPSQVIDSQDFCATCKKRAASRLKKLK